VDKKIILFLALIFLFSFVSAESLSGVVVPSKVPLNESLIISGHYSGDSVDGNILCSFRIFDVYEDNRLIWRLSDEYTSADGFFNNSPFALNEPIFQRGKDYNAVVCCNIVCFDQNFYVGQKEDLAFGKTAGSLIMDFAFLSDSNNSYVWFLGLLMLFFLLYIFFTVKSIYFK